MAETATGIVREMLKRYGLEFTEAQVNQWVGLVTDDPNNASIVDEQIRDSPTFNARFPGLKARRDNGLNAIPVSRYLQLEDQYKTILRNSGLPERFYDTPEEMGQLIANEVSPEEFEARVIDGFMAAKSAPAEVRDALSEFYGLQDADAALAAFFLDPDRGLEAVQRQFQSAQIGARAKQTGFGSLDRQQAERLEALGITDAAAQQGFGTLAAQSANLTQNLGQGQTFSTDEQLDAEFAGDTELLKRMQDQRKQRQAAFKGQAGGFPDARGVIGVRDTSGTPSP